MALARGVRPEHDEELDDDLDLQDDHPGYDALHVPPDMFDEVVSTEIPEDLGADFVPIEHSDAHGHVRRQEIDPFQYDSLQAQEAFDAAVAAAESGDEALAVQEFLRASKIAETAREWYLAAVACRRVGDFLATPPPPQDLEKAFRMYRRAIAAYERCGLSAEARELGYREKLIRLRKSSALKLPWPHRVELFLHWAVAGFGYRPTRVIGTAGVMVLIYALIYWATDGVAHGQSTEHIDFWTALYFSGITFATVGYGDFIPAPHTRLLALTEGFLGAFTLGFFVAVLAHRLSKS